MGVIKMIPNLPTLVASDFYKDAIEKFDFHSLLNESKELALIENDNGKNELVPDNFYNIIQGNKTDFLINKFLEMLNSNTNFYRSYHYLKGLNDAVEKGEFVKHTGIVGFYSNNDVDRYLKKVTSLDKELSIGDKVRRAGDGFSYYVGNSYDHDAYIKKRNSFISLDKLGVITGDNNWQNVNVFLVKFPFELNWDLSKNSYVNSIKEEERKSTAIFHPKELQYIPITTMERNIFENEIMRFSKLKGNTSCVVGGYD